MTTKVPVELVSLDGGVIINEGSADADFRVESNDNANMLFVDGGNNRVGIGTGTPEYELEVKASTDASINIRAGTSSGDFAGIYFGDTDYPAEGRITYQNSDNKMRFWSDRQHVMTLDDNARMGIGTESPSTTLHAATGSDGSGLVDVARFQNTGTSVSDGARIQLTAGTSTSGAGIGCLGVALNSSHLVFHSGGNTERMRIDSSGNVGIGNSSPSSYDSNARNLVIGSGSGDEGMTIASGSGSGGRIYFADGTSSDGEKGDGYIFYNHASNYMAFGTSGGTENARFLDGSLLIGSTTLDGNSQKFQVFQNANNKFTGAFICDGNNANRFGPMIRCGTDDNSGTNTMLTFQDGDGSGIGTITSSGGTVTYGAFTAHHEVNVPDEDNPSDDSDAYPYGTLVEVTSVYLTEANKRQSIRYTVQKSQSANSKKVLGAYSSNMRPSPMCPTTGTYANNLHNVSILGDGHILCNNSGGNIEVGDGICTSAVEGIGMKATANPSMIVGIAQEDVTFSGTETKLVAVQFGVQQFTPWS